MKLLNYQKHKKLIQVFPAVCKYSCSKHNEVRNFILIHEYSEVRVLFFKLKFFEQLKIICDNCGWSKIFPAKFGKKAFHKGINANLLMDYAGSHLVTNRFAIFWASLWKYFLFLLGVFVIFLGARARFENVRIGSPKDIDYTQIYRDENQGKLVRVRGKLNFVEGRLNTIANPDNPLEIYEQIPYIPLYSPYEAEKKDFVIVKGGSVLRNEASIRTNINSVDEGIVDYNVIGILRPLDSVIQGELRNYFVSDLPEMSNSSVPEILLDASDYQDITEFLRPFILAGVLITCALVSSIMLQLYFDRKFIIKGKSLQKL